MENLKILLADDQRINQTLVAAILTKFGHQVECVFNGYWGERVRPYLSEADWRTLSALCDPDSEDFCLRRDDFHHMQTLTVVTGHLTTP